MANKGIAYTVSGVLALLVAAGGYGMAIKPKIESAQTIKTSIAAESTYRDTMVEMRMRAESVKADFPAIAAEAAQFNAAFPTASDQAGLLDAINSAANKGKVEVSTISPAQTMLLEDITKEIQDRIDTEALETGVQLTADGDPRYTYMSVDMNVSGNRQEQRAFLRALEDLDRKLYIQNVASTVVGNAEGELQVTLIAMITAPLVDPTVPVDEEAAAAPADPAAPAAGEGQ